jgi:hypothetical protein
VVIPKKAKIAIISLLIIAIGLFAVALLVFYSRQTTPSEQTTEEISTPTVKLEIFSSRVFVQLPDSDEWLEAEDGQDILVNSQIKTDEDGQGQLVYPNGTVTRLDNASLITLKEFNSSPFQVKVFLEAGRIWSRITKLLGQESYQTESANLVASVRGTSYGHEILANGQDLVTVSKSQVSSRCLGDDQEIIIDKDNQATFNCQVEARPKPVKTPLKEREKEWFKFNQDHDEKLEQRFGRQTYDDYDQAPSPSPNPTSTPTPSPTPTPTPTSIPTPTPSPTPTPPTISKVDANECARKRTIGFFGSGFEAKTSVRLKDKQGIFHQAEKVNFINSGEMNAFFPEIPTGDYCAQVSNDNKNWTTSSDFICK